MFSPPPLRHPVPKHPSYIPEPPSTPVSPHGYQRYSSSPVPPTLPPYANPYAHNLPPANLAPWDIDTTTAQLGMRLGHSAVAAGQEYMQRNFGTLFPTTNLKHHFNVSNSYVMLKLKLILFPWSHKPWVRRVRRSDNGQSEWQPPRDDINSPDLYIPVMAIVTYILLTAIHRGLEKNFNPKILGESASRAIAVVILDFVFVKLGCYFLNIQGSSQVVDLIAYGGYKFIGVILTITSGFLKSSPMWTLVFIYSFLANAFFLLRSLRSVVLPDPSISISTNPNPTTTVTVNPAQRRRRITFLFFEAVLQILYMAILVRI
ncbi:Protein transport protein yif1 [Leucoagaricus gongylophorus]